MPRLTGSLAALVWVTQSAQAAVPVPPATAPLEPLFAEAGQEFSVPVRLLQGVAFVESHWSQVVPAPADDEDGHQRVFGVMGLRDDDWFGRSLANAASLLGKTPEELSLDPAANIRGAAALLSTLARQAGLDTGEAAFTANPWAWMPVLAKYSGIPDAEDQSFYVHDVYAVLRAGFDGPGIHIAANPEMPVPDQTYSQPFPGMGIEPEAADYPGATWDPSPNFNVDANHPQFVIIHMTEGSFAGAVSWLKNPKAKVSAHYVIRSSDGFVKQLVHDKDKAWHVRCWNAYTIGVEHEGWDQQPAYLTEAMYKSSAKLVKYITQKHHIPEDALHIVGHDFWSKPEFKGSPLQKVAGTCNDHRDPGPYWDWAGYLRRVKTAL